MKKITLFLVMLGFFLTASAQYDFAPIVGPTNVASGTPSTLNLNDVANATGVPASSTGSYDSFSISVDWVAGAGNPWSSEGDVTVTTTAGSVLVNPPTTGGMNSNANTTLTFVGNFTAIYNPTTDGFIDLVLNQSFGGSDADWSNIVVTLFESPTCPDISSLTVANITVNSADISWVAGDTETTWEIAIQTAGTGVPAGSGVSTTNNNPYSATGLTPSTAYEVYVRADCGGTDGFGAWIGPLNFSTTNIPPPPPVGVTCNTGSSSFIFTEDFEIDPPAGWTGTDFSGNNGDWRITAGNENSGGTGPFASFSGGMHLEYEASGNSSTIASAISPAIDLTTAVDGAELSFNMHAFGADIGTLNVGIANSAAGPFTNLYTWIGEFQATDTDDWVPIGINLDAYLGQTIYIEFSYGGAGTGFEGDLSIDLFRVESCGSFCIAPSIQPVANITGTTADFNWTANSGETAWEYVVSFAGTGEPAGAGNPVATTTVNETGLAFSTDYEFWVRADCGGGNFSVWSGPINFTTTAQTDFSVDCTQPPLQFNYCYNNNDTTFWVFTSTDGSPVRLTFDSGTIEGGFDDLTIYDGPNNTGTILFNNNTAGLNDFAGLTFDSTGDSLFMEVDSDGSVSCASGSRTEWVFSAACATCVNPVATYAVRSDCINSPQFFVDVDLTDLGSATSITLSDDQGSAPQVVNAIGLYSFGPFANLTPVIITVANDDDTNCLLTSSALTQEFCLDNFVDCNAGPVNVSYCYDNNDTNVFTFTSSDGSPLNITINSGNVENNFDELVILDTDGVTDLNAATPYGVGGNITGITYQSSGDTISLSITSDGSVSCGSGSGGLVAGIDYTVACATCINPQATYQVVDDCANGDQFLIDVDVTSLGDAASVSISDNQGSTPVSVSATGVTQFGPYPFLVDVIITISNDQDVNCVINSSAIQLLACPPDNDNCDGATVALVNDDGSCALVTSGTILAATPSGVPVGSCGGNPDDDVWFQFTALSEVQLISLINVAGGTFNLDHGVYEGSCGTLTELYCSNDDASVTPQLTIGNTYYIRVFSGGSDDETSTFDLCIREAPTNIICDNAESFCSDGTGGLTSPNIIGIPNTGQIACLFTAPNPTWNIIQIGDTGLIEIEIAQVDDLGNGLDVDFVLWGPFASLTDACDNLDIGCPTPGDCPNNTTNPNFYPSGNIVDCSYSGAPIENLTIDNAISGEIYILLVTNFSNNPGNVTITQTNGGGGAGDGTVTAEIEAEITSLEVVFVDDDADPGTPDVAAVCGFDSVTIEADSPFADTYIWYQDGFVIPGETSATLTVTESDVYQVQAFDDQCDDDAFSQVVSIKLYQDPGSIENLNLTVCDGPSDDGVEDFDLDALSASLGLSAAFVVTYYATQNDANQAINPLTSPYTSAGETIYLRAEDVDAAADSFLGCRQLAEVVLVVDALPVANQPPDLVVCDDDTDGVTDFDLTIQDSEINDTGNIVVITYHASEEDANNNVGALSSPHTSSGETIYVRVEDEASGCYNITSFDLVVDVVPQANFDPNIDYEVCPNATMPIDIAIIPINFTEGEVTIEWFLDGGLIAGENGLTLPVLVQGDYTAEITFISTLCFYSVTQFVVELEACVIPEGFSPNGDGINETFDLSSFDVTKIEIFNRYGTRIFSKTNYTNEWHGQDKDGEILPVGTYFYTITYDGGKQKSDWVYINY